MKIAAVAAAVKGKIIIFQVKKMADSIIPRDFKTRSRLNN